MVELPMKKNIYTYRTFSYVNGVIHWEIENANMLVFLQI